MQIEPMLPKHAEKIAEIEKECFSSPWTAEMIKSELKRPRSLWCIVTENGTVAGYMGMYEACGEGNITNIAVTQKYRRKGFAKALLAYFIKYAEENGYEFLTLEVREDNTPAIKLYESFGFRLVGIRKNYYEGKINAHLMTLFFKQRG